MPANAAGGRAGRMGRAGDAATTDRRSRARSTALGGSAPRPMRKAAGVPPSSPWRSAVATHRVPPEVCSQNPHHGGSDDTPPPTAPGPDPRCAPKTPTMGVQTTHLPNRPQAPPRGVLPKPPPWGSRRHTSANRPPAPPEVCSQNPHHGGSDDTPPQPPQAPPARCAPKTPTMGVQTTHLAQPPQGPTGGVLPKPPPWGFRRHTSPTAPRAPPEVCSQNPHHGGSDDTPPHPPWQPGVSGPGGVTDGYRGSTNSDCCAWPIGPSTSWSVPLAHPMPVGSIRVRASTRI